METKMPHFHKQQRIPGPCCSG